MNRTNALFGRDTIDLSVNGLKSTQLKALVQIGFKTEGVLTGHYANNEYRFYDVQDFVPDYEAKLPVFSGMLEIDYQQWTNLRLIYQRNGVELSQVQFDVLRGAGRRMSRQFDNFLQTQPVKFLTNLPRAQLMPMTGTAYLCFPVNFIGTTGTVSLRVIATMPNGDVETKTGWSGTLQNSTVYNFNVSPYHVTKLFAVLPVRYTVQIYSSDNTILSESFTYELTANDNFLTFIYVNSYGRFDAINLTCDYEMGLQVEPQRVQNNRLVNRVNTEARRRLNVEFLQLTEEMKEPLTELLLSRAVYLFDSQRHIPLDCTTTDITYLKTLEYFESIAVEFLIAHTNNSY